MINEKVLGQGSGNGTLFPRRFLLYRKKKEKESVPGKQKQSFKTSKEYIPIRQKDCLRVMGAELPDRRCCLIEMDFLQ